MPSIESCKLSNSNASSHIRMRTRTISARSADYSREELVAELTSAFCCASLGLDNSLLDDAASYIGGWINALQSDPKAIVTAAGQAQRAADYMRGLGHSEDQASADIDQGVEVLS
jgi:antirestriction protein ArdC